MSNPLNVWVRVTVAIIGASAVTVATIFAAPSFVPETVSAYFAFLGGLGAGHMLT